MAEVIVLYNTDYDAELIAESGADVSAVAASALAVCQGAKDAGIDAEVLGCDGEELASVVARLRQASLVLNLCESLRGDARNEVVFPAILDLYQVPYTGADAFTLKLCLHKDRCRDALKARGVSVPEGFVLSSLEECPTEITAPMILKLAHEDASVGIDDRNVVSTASELKVRCGELLEKYRQPVVAEQFIEGREINATLLARNGVFEVLPLHEISFADMPEGRPHIVSYAAKWDETHVDYEGTKPVPAKDVPPAVQDAVARVAVEAATLCGLRDYGRVDMRVDRDGVPYVIDVNPNCDISPDAGFSRAARAGGISYPQMIERICLEATRRTEH